VLLEVDEVIILSLVKVVVFTETVKELDEIPIEVVGLAVPIVVSITVPVNPLIPAPEDEVKVNKVDVVVVPVSLRYVETLTNGIVKATLPLAVMKELEETSDEAEADKAADPAANDLAADDPVADDLAADETEEGWITVVAKVDAIAGELILDGRLVEATLYAGSTTVYWLEPSLSTTVFGIAKSDGLILVVTPLLILSRASKGAA
jgi:hypothetical protein